MSEAIPLGISRGNALTTRPNNNNDSGVAGFRLPPRPGRGGGFLLPGGIRGGAWQDPLKIVDVYEVGEGWNPSALALPELPAGLSDAIGCVFVDATDVERVLVLGGFDSDFNYSTQAVTAEFGGSSWTSVAGGQGNLSQGHAFDAGGGEVIVGSNNPQRVTTYDSDSGVWTEITIPVTGGNFIPLSSGRLRSGRILTLGRVGSAYNRSAIYDPATKTWTEGPTLPHSVGNYNAGLLVPVGKGVVAVYTDGLNRATLFDEVTQEWGESVSLSGGFDNNAVVRQGFEASESESWTWSSSGGSWSFVVQYLYAPLQRALAYWPDVEAIIASLQAQVDALLTGIATGELALTPASSEPNPPATGVVLYVYDGQFCVKDEAGTITVLSQLDEEEV